MNDFISRDELFKRFQKQAMTLYGKDSERYQMVMDIMDGVRFAPAVDAELVVHGHWIECSNELNKKCSVCHKVNGTIYYHEPHCPNCGAKMDEVSE